VELFPLNKDYDTIELDAETDYKTIGILKCVLKTEETNLPIFPHLIP